ncbi:hypothetical protein CL658_02680 [bacterium]|nr:hypothetical protein [bacterium]|tara:strand:+ start:807 stop:1343 length:537 start_codon:yes stop_codon:yes gene_type:complete
MIQRFNIPNNYLANYFDETPTNFLDIIAIVFYFVNHVEITVIASLFFAPQALVANKVQESVEPVDIAGKKAVLALVGAENSNIPTKIIARLNHYRYTFDVASQDDAKPHSCISHAVEEVAREKISDSTEKCTMTVTNFSPNKERLSDRVVTLDVLCGNKSPEEVTYNCELRHIQPYYF